MALTLIHTSDWHLGHSLESWSREEEQAAFLDWLAALITTEQADALVVAGDLFDTSNPSAAAQRLFFRFLAQLRQSHPQLCLVLVGGNHDSAARLDAPEPVLSALDIHVIGGLPVEPAEWARLFVPVRDREGAVAAWIVAAPYLRPVDLPPLPEEEGVDPLIQGVQEVYSRLLAAVPRQPEQALLVTGHCYMVGAALSERSERKILGGNLHALPTSIFPDTVSYVALGHLHLPQKVGAPHIRYSGSPYPLAVDERDYPHQVLVVRLDGPTVAEIRPVRTPRSVQFLRVPARDFATLPEVEAALRALPRWEGPMWQRPYLEVAVRLDTPVAGLRARLEDLIVGRARLLAVRVFRAGEGSHLVAHGGLSSVSPEWVFRERWRKQQGDTPIPEAVMEGFQVLLERAQHGEE